MVEAPGFELYMDNLVEICLDKLVEGGQLHVLGVVAHHKAVCRVEEEVVDVGVVVGASDCGPVTRGNSIFEVLGVFGIGEVSVVHHGGETMGHEGHLCARFYKEISPEINFCYLPGVVEGRGSRIAEELELEGLEVPYLGPVRLYCLFEVVSRLGIQEDVSCAVCDCV